MSSLPIADYHMHTPLCGHASGKPREYAQQAQRLGLEEIGFSDHAPLVSHEDPKITMNLKQLPQYHQMIEDVVRDFPSLRVKIALEADFIPGFEKKTKAILESHPYDYVIGSIHFINRWGFDDPAERLRWDQKDIDTVYREYYSLLRQSAESGLFDIMGHVDLVKKFGHRATADMKGEVEATAKVFKKTGVAVEINTSGLRKPVQEMYPSPECLRIYQKAGVPLTFGSDAHAPQDVGKDFDKAVALAKSVGFTEYLLFKQKKIERIVKF